MSVIRRFNKPQGLKDIDVLIEDDAPISLFFNVVEVPEVITQGKSSFLIGGSNLLKPEVEIKFEITNDDTGAVIYTEPVSGYLEGTSRRVSIEVYEDVDLFGDATLTVVGELNPNNNNVPPEFRDTYNVRYTRKIYVSSAGVNTQPILFYNQPRIVVTEIVKPYITTTFPTASITKTGGATGEPIPEEIGKTLNVENDEEPAKFVKKLKNNLRFKLFGGGGNNAFVRRGRRRARRASPEVDKFTIQNTSGDKFDARFVGGEIKIPSPQVDTTKFTLEPYHQVPTEYKSDVEDVKNENILVPEKPFTIIDTRFDEDDPQRNVIAPLATENLTYTASMDSVPTQSISTVNFRSYADIRLSRLRTFSGDIDRVKIYARNKDAFGDFELVSDQQIESPELLFNVFGAGNQRLGYFLNQEHINQYWVSSSNATITSNSSYLLNAARISGSNEGVNSFVTFEQSGSLPISFTKDTEYNISFNALGFKGDKNTVGGSERSGRMGIFISGSGFRVNHDYGNDLGYQLEVNDQPAFLNVSIGEQQDFGQVSEIFSPQVDGNGVLKLVVFSGEFYVSDISINPATSTGFSPNFVQIIAPVPPLTQERPDDYEFFAEFYDVNNNVAESVVFASSSTFVGGNSYIAGGDNLLSGSMFIGSAIGGGIEMAGVNSGFIRSIGYTGFTSASNPSLGSPGFLMFSGSVLPDSGDDYKGVGLELVGGANTFFKFRTNPSELDIRTDSFFIGQESIQFISGSDGNIEISSSLFHLDPKNELLVIGADAVINADLTVNNLRTPAQIGGLPSTEQNASASISSQGFAAFRSASIGGFDVDETTIASTDDSLILKSDGQMTGSSTLIGNKSAGQFLQFKGSTLTVQGDITANNIRTPASINGAPSTDANASASITADGLATFKSGSIAGWKIFGNKLSGSNATLDADGAALYKSDQGPGTDTAAAFDQLRNEYYIDFTPTGSNSSNFYIKMGPNFGVDKDGVLFASGAVFEGSITASSGKIGGFSIETASLSSTNIFISGSPLAGGNDDPRYMFISTSNFNVKEDGSVTGSQVLFDGGKVGGWNINENQLSANNIKINAAVGYIEAGDLNNVSDYQDSSTGFFVNKDGEILLKAGTSANKNYMRFAGGTLDIRTNDFELDTNNLELSSTEASMSLGEGKIILQGATTSTITLGNSFKISSDGTDEFLSIGSKTSFTHFDQSTAGVIMGMDNTTPKFEVAADANNYLSFDGSGLDIKAGTFDLATSTTIIDSGTNSGKIALGSTPPSSYSSGTGFYVDGTGKFLVGDASANKIQFNGTQIIIKSPDFFLGDSTNFISGSNGDMQIQSGKFELDANNIEISSTHASMSLGEGKIKMIGAGTSTITVGAANAITLSDDGTDRFLVIGSKTSFTHFNQSTAGFIVGTDSGTTKFELVGDSNNYLSFDGSQFDIKLQQGLELDATNIEISSTNASMSLGEGKILLDGANGRVYVGSTSSKRIEIVGTAGQGYIATGKSSATDTTAGFWLANNNTDPEFVVGNSTNFIKFDGGELDIASEKLEISASTIQISTAEASMSLGHSSTYPLGRLVMEGVGTPTFKMGPDVGFISMTTGSGIYMDGDGNFRFGDDDGHIKFQNGAFSITGSDVNINVDTIDIQTSAFELSSTHASMSLGTNRQWKASGGDANPFLSIGQSGNGVYGNSGLFLGYNSSTSRPRVSFVGSTSHLKFDSDLDIKTGTLELDATNIEISSTNASMSLGEGNLLLDGANSKIEVGSANKVTIQGGSTDNFITMGSKTSFSHFNQSTQGIIIGMDSTVPKLEMVGNATNYLSFDGTNFDIKLSEGLELDANNIELSSTHASMSLGEGKIKLVGGSTSTLTVGASNSIKLSDDGTDRFLVIGSKTSFSHFNQSTAGFIVGTDGGTTKFELVGSATNYLSFDGTNFDVKLSQGLELDANNIELSSTHASMSLGSDNDINLDGVNKKITIGSANAVTIQGGSTDNFIVMGSKSSFSQFDQSTAGIIMGMDSSTAKMELVGNSSNYISFNGSAFDIKLSQGLELDASNIELSSTHASMSIGDTNPIILQSIGSDRVLRFGNKTDFGQTTTAGFIMGIDNGVPKLDFTVGTSNDNFFRIDSSGVSLQSDNINIDTDRFKITTNAGNERIRFFSGSDSDSGRVTGAGEFVRIGEVSDDASDLYGLKIYDGTGTGSADTLVKLGQDGNEIAGWTITQDRLSGGQMIIRSDGTIESSGFASDVAGSGFRLTAADGGFLEVENAKIRGTMATAVFEKESVNAVGGQLYVANSTTLTGSSFPTALAGGGRTAGDYPANETTMSVENVTGFVQGEILSLKKVTDSGFSTEYVFVNSASRQNPSSETDFSGQLYVTRGYGSGISGDSGSLGDTPSSAQSYSGSQVIVSTGRYISGDAPNTVGSGYIRMNANPADPTTPYIDIIERTGSGIYDVSLKARLGDLSGLSSGLLYGETNPGFGLFTENVFLQGGITATTGSITGKLFVDTSSSQKMIFGIGVDGGSNDGIFINANNYWYTNGVFKVGSATYNIQHDSSGNISITPKTFELDATNLEISSTNASMSLGEGNILLDGVNNKIKVGAHSANNVEIVGSNTQGYIRTGKTSVTDTTSGFWLANNNSDPEFSVGSATNFLKYDGGTLSIETQQLELAANTDDLQISSTQKSMSLAAGNVLLDGGGNVGYVRIGSNSTYDRNINISGSSTQAIIKAGKTSFSDTTNAGFVLEKTNTDSRFFVGDASSVNQIKFDTSGGVDIKTQKLEVDAGDIEISSTHNSMSLGQGKIDLVGGSTSTITVGSSNSITLSDDGTDRFIGIGKSGFSQFDQSTAGFIVGTDNGTTKFELVGSVNNYVSFNGSTFDMKLAQGFELAVGTDDLQISSTQKSMSLAGGNVLLDGAQTTGYIRVGSAVQRNNNINISGSNTLAVIKAGFTGSYADGVSAGDNGFILERNLTNTKFHVGSGTEYIRFDGTNIDISAANFSVTASDVNIAAGNSISIDTPDFELSSTQKSMSLGYDTNGDVGINIVGGDPSTIFFGSKTSPPLKLVADDQSGVNEYFLATNNKAFGDTTAGVIIGSDAGVQKLELYKDANEFFTYSSDNGFDLRTTKLDITTGAGLTISGVDGSTAANNKILLGSATNVDAGEGIFMDGGGNFRVGDATSGGTNFLKFTSGGTLTIKSEDIDITSTAFELVANTDDLQISSTHKSMSLAGQKIVIEGSSTNGSLKIGGVSSVTDTTGANKGFYAEGDGDFIAKAGANKYIQFNGGDLDVKTDKLQIDASDFEVSSTEASMSLGEGKIKLIGASTSTITVGAASSITLSDDGTDRFIAVGKSNFSDFNQSTAGFIVGTDNGTPKFEVAVNSSNYISLNGSNLDIKTSNFNLTGTSGTISLGTLANASDVADSSTGFHVDSSGNVLIKAGTANTGYIRAGLSSIIMKSSDFFLGDATNHISGSGGNMNIKSVNFELDAGNLEISSANVSMSLGEGKIRLVGGSTSTITVADNFKISSDGTDEFLAIGSKTSFTHFDQSTAGVIMGVDDTTTKFEVVGNSSNYLSFNGTAFDIKSQTFDLNATSIIIDSSGDSGAGVIRLGGSGGPSSPTADVAGIYMDGGGALNVYGDASNYLRFDGGSVDIRTDEILIQTAGTNKLKLSADGSNTPTFAMGATLNTSVAGTNKGIFMNGEGDFLLRGNASNFFKFDASGNTIEIKSDTFDLDASTIVMDSAGTGKIALGASPPSDHTSGTGFYVDGDGNLLLGSTGGSFIQYAASSGHITINSQIFNLFTSTLVIDSSTNNGKIALGATPNTDVEGTNAGVYMDGTGNFLVRGDANNFLKFDSDENSIVIKSDTFDLATNNLVIDSGTNSGKIALGSSPPSAYNSGTGFYADGAGNFKIGNSEANNINFDGTDLQISSSLFLSGSMTVGTAESQSAQPHSFISVGKPSSPTDNTSGVEVRKDYFATYTLTGGEIHACLDAKSNSCTGVDNTCTREEYGNNLRYVVGCVAKPSYADTAGKPFLRTSYEVHKEATVLFTRLVSTAATTADGLPDGTFDYQSSIYGSAWGGHVGLKAEGSANNESGYIAIGSGLMTEIAYVTAQVPSPLHSNVGAPVTDSQMKEMGGLIFWGSSVSIDGVGDQNCAYITAAFPSGQAGNYSVAGFGTTGNRDMTHGSGTSLRAKGLSVFGYNVTTVIRDCFNRGIFYENKANTPDKNPEDYVEAESSSGKSPGDLCNDWSTGYPLIYVPLPMYQPHGDSPGQSVNQVNDHWARSSRKIVTFDSTPVVTPMIMVGKGGKILAIDKDEVGAAAGVGYKIYSEFQTEREGGVAGYESIPSTFA